MHNAGITIKLAYASRELIFENRHHSQMYYFESITSLHSVCTRKKDAGWRENSVAMLAGDLSLFPPNPCKTAAHGVHTCNLSTEEAETGRSLELTGHAA